jgi:DNA-binding SARP family transcriptional activator
MSPDYADAHFNLAAALARTGRNEAAARHWQRYLQLDAGSPWARIARVHLDMVEHPERGGPE